MWQSDLTGDSLTGPMGDMCQTNYMSWKGACQVCGKLRRRGAGIFCSNFLLARGPFPPCNNVWCGECYRPATLDPFPVQELDGEEDAGDLEVDRPKKHDHKRGRDGDHLMGVPFECDLCHFRNVTGRNPCWESAKDSYTLTCIRRANLDVMWSRATSTVELNLSRSQTDYFSAVQLFDMKSPLPILGSPEVRDRVGMGVALMMLNASLRPGKYEGHLQPDSVRKTRSWWNNAYLAGRGYGTDAVFAKDGKKLNVTSSVTSGDWFGRFYLGLKMRTGQVRKQNEALTIAVVLGCAEAAEDLRAEALDEGTKERIEETMCFMLASCGAVVRGEEVPLLSLDGMLSYWDASVQHDKPHIMLTLKGKFKGENDVRWHCVPVSLAGPSQIPFRLWFGRLIRRRVELQNRSEGPLLRGLDGRTKKIKDLDPTFLEILDRARFDKPDLINNTVETGDYSLWRSGRRGANTEATNLKVPEDTMFLLGRWRRREAASGTEPGLPIRQVYTQVSHALGALLAYSEAL